MIVTSLVIHLHFSCNKKALKVAFCEELNILDSFMYA